MRRHDASPLLVIVLLCVIAAVSAGCARNQPTPTPPPMVVPPFSQGEIGADEIVIDVAAADGGSAALTGGAALTLPPDALAQDARVTFRTVAAPPAPIPSSIIGAAYELEIDGSELTGVAQVRLPLPAGVTLDQYQLAPHRWTGRLWERVTARDTNGGVQFGVSAPDVFAILGSWRLADATLALVKPETLPGQQAVPLTVVGRYRYSAIPALQDGLVPAQLTLKQDTSGGAGLVYGDPTQDATVDEATVWFKPDPAQSQGLIEFTHVFEVLPGRVALNPGINTRFYAVMQVDDAAAPTRRVSTGVEYTQVLPIQIQDMQVVRPVLLQEDRLALRWKITLNDLTFQTPEARGPTLALQPILDGGGVGDYRITLEAQNEGEWVTVSNELTIQLALRPTATLQPGETPLPTPVIASGATPIPVAPPVAPTRRPTPDDVSIGGIARLTPTITPTLSVSASATPTRPDWASVFWADRYAVAPGECTILHWKVEDVISVFFEGQAVTGNETRQVCPAQTTTYVLSVTGSSGSQDRTVTVQVAEAGESPVMFTAEPIRIAAGSCATLTWSAVDVREVFLNGAGVAGVASQQVCPAQTTDYELRVVNTAGQTTVKRLTITVVQGAASVVDAAFWAEQYTMPQGGCTTLHWNVRNVVSIYLDGDGVTGEGSRQACPESTQFYTLEIMDTSGQVNIKEVVLMAGDPGLTSRDIIAQGVIGSISSQPDVNVAEPGEQPGYDIVIDGIRLLYAGTPGINLSRATVRLPQTAIDLGDNGPVHWPMRPGQQVEFRAGCDGETCYFDYYADAYLYWRSE